jgi:transcription elongation GreA/GreB family factor
MAKAVDKRALKDELVKKLSATLAELEKAHRATLEGATHEEAKPEDDKDTRALEQSYLARGQAERVAQLRAAVAEVKGMPVRAVVAQGPVDLGALVTAEEDEETLRYFLAPQGGGTVLGKGVQVVTPSSPLGRALLGKREGDECEVQVGGKRRELSITQVA